MPISGRRRSMIVKRSSSSAANARTSSSPLLECGGAIDRARIRAPDTKRPIVADLVDEGRSRAVGFRDDLRQEMPEVWALQQHDRRVVRRVEDRRDGRVWREIEDPVITASVIRDREA